ncbi:MAG: type II toxin-antitoxin system YafQ family toxin [bacterium]|nr:type II toxin-antitoxin system YafQ family toxin [bacterium]
MYKVVLSRRYKTVLKRYSRRNDFSHETLKEIIRTLARGEKLEQRYQDHQLSGELQEYRECHIKHNLLLTYQKHENVLVLLLINLGTHDDLFR